jgi:hypothetical protein
MLQGRQEVPPEVRGEALSREAEELMSHIRIYLNHLGPVAVRSRQSVFNSHRQTKAAQLIQHATENDHPKVYLDLIPTISARSPQSLARCSRNRGLS